MAKQLKFVLYFFLTFFLFQNQSVFAQKYTNSLNSANLKTLTIFRTDEWSSLPVINFGSSQTIQLGFDEMSHNYNKFSYRIIHCNSDWTKSDLTTLDYLEGFAENDLEDGETSMGTYATYTHYQLKLPNADIQLKLSGNYAIEVFDKYKPEEILLTACFRISENVAIVKSTLTASTDIDFRQEHQQLSFSVQTNGMSIHQPLDEIKVIIQKNNNNLLSENNLTPSGMNGSLLLYEHDPKLIFKAGNEYRRFDITTHRYAGINVNRIEYFKPYYNAELNPSDKRTKGYIFDKDQNGRFIVHSQDAVNDAIGSDYFMVHFAFPMEKPFIDGAIYLTGDLVQNRMDATSKLSYSFERKAYEKDLLLKQGSYNYQYMFKRSSESTGDLSFLEGSYWETENEYQIYVYYRPIGGRYDRLIAFNIAQTSF